MQAILLRRCSVRRSLPHARLLGPARLASAVGPSARRREEESTSHTPAEPDSLWAANRITLIGAGVNVASAFSKGVAGVLISSPGLIADAAHSVTDLLSDVVTLWAVNHARVPASMSTPWGLGKLESVGGSVCAGIIVVTGLGVGVHSAHDLWGKVWAAHSTSGGAAAIATSAASQPSDGAFLTALANTSVSLGPLGECDVMLLGGVLAALSGVLAKEWLYRETLRIGNATRSATMVANAWHHRTDALSSFVALGGLVGSGLGFPALDSVAGLAVAAMVTRVGVEMGYSAIQELVDSQVEPETIERVKALIGSSPDVVSTTHVRGRKLGPWLAFDLRMQVPFAVSVSAAKQIATKAKLRVLENMPEVYDVVICIDAERPARTDFSREVIVGSHAHTPANRRSDSWAHGAHGGGAHGGGGALQAQGAGQPLHLRRYKLMRSPDDYDRDVRAALVRHALAGPNLFWGLTHSNVHWNTRKGGALVEASLVCDPRMRVGDAHALARRAHSAVLATVPDVIEVDLHLELFEKGAMVDSMAALPAEWQLPSEAEADAWIRESLAPLCSQSGCDRPLVRFAAPAREQAAGGSAAASLLRRRGDGSNSEGSH